MTARFDFAAAARGLPVAEALPDLTAALATRGVAVLEAPPGAGKTTLVPLALLDAPWLAGKKLLMLEPRRLATRAAARRMASLLGESAGNTVGFRTRLESRIGPQTRIEVLTEGILPRMIEDDPALDGVGGVIFDEFHERSLEADLGLALALETRKHLRPELRLLVMSATLEGEKVAALLGDAKVIASQGKMFPVEIRNLDRPAPERFEAAVAAAVRRALGEDSGSVLVFLPGGAEIRRVARLLESDLPAGVSVAPLYGDLPPQAQDDAIQPAPPGKRKVVLATSIAETSLTIEGIRVVIDGGLMRAPRFDPASGMERLVTLRVSQASAKQRSGRAGRLEPGVAYRLWPAREEMQLAPFNAPEILQADLAPLALALAQWGAADPHALSFLDPPPEAAYAEAQNLLRELGALDAANKITAHGKAMAGLGLHPRLAHMALRGKERGSGTLACAIAALLMERDVLRAGLASRDADFRLRVELMAERGAAKHLPTGMTLDRGGLERARDAARQLRQRLGIRGDSFEARETGRLLALAYPDRIAQKRPGAPGQFLLANGKGAELAASDPLANAEFLAVADLDAARRNARIFLAATLTRDELEEDFGDLIATADTIAWDVRAEAVLARRRATLGALVLEDKPLAKADPARVAATMAEGIRALGIGALPWSQSAENLRARIAFLHRLDSDAWPDWSDAALLASVDEWLAPYIGGITRRAQLAGLDLAEILAARLAYDQRRALDRLAPTHVTAPSGSRIAIDYAGATPVLAVKLQEMFGARESPAVADGRVKLLIHLLSPAGRPLAVTQDLAGFWRNAYPQVRGEMRGRYPRHPWPDDPLAAAPTKRTKRR
ncbi:MAG TPA: ATP-dependent helicase HrpB [Candidatus Binataceae bacterium]|nr:ATP-dependent helicase HrpB [Candidatus Binataceae bacterium]